jgi:ribonuclease HI
MMARLNIFVDSATKHTSKDNKYGESVAAWAAWWGDDFSSAPARCGIIYLCNEGPNKTFYQGIIRSLEQCLSLAWGDEVYLHGDCQTVINQLKGN